ncbi:P1 family peptidase [Mycobacterium sp. NAZ190054]|uniref:DmpA family aminopeptidase n=1 Tax=Mycobacterium sp. NAZ190054 TaxID=1747766 RepID=UPI00079B6B6A|nr:P1 family peptidase [Mycobacterium sp. NAZ190054]KWX56645.1 aminopeptidase [Mycobacterium sp. NAZ190054]
MIHDVTPVNHATHTIDGRPRARGVGIDLPGRTGPLNALTDVPGVQLGVTTLIEGDGPLVVGRGPVRTGVTAILPRGVAGAGQPCAAGWYSLNGNGEMTGTTWIEEVGSFNLPVVLSNTHAVGACHTGVVRWANRVAPRLARQWLLPVCTETWDGYLNDINGGHVRPDHVEAALDAATGGPVPEGSVGGGTGMNCYEFKGGNGTSSRLVPYGARTYTVAAFVQANFGARHELTVAGRHVGPLLADDNPLDGDWFARDLAGAPPPGAGSVIVIVATDAPLLPGQCKALARRVPLGLARTGTTGSHFSGDIFLAFSTADVPDLASEFPLGPVGDDDIGTIRFLPWGRMDDLYTAVVQSVEEAVLNALVVNTDMVGRDGHRSPRLSLDRLAAALGRTP